MSRLKAIYSADLDYSFPLIEDLIQFGIGGNDKPYIMGGFSHPEEGFRWTRGNKAVLAFDVSGKIKGDFNLVCDVFPLVTEKRLFSSVKVSIYGTSIGAWEISKKKKRGMRLRVPASLGKDGKYVIEFGLPDAVSPKELGIGEDTRQLALAFRKIVIEY
jgi:hypothetical protein